MLQYTMAHPDFYETLSRYSATPEYRDRLESLLPPTGWQVTRSDCWLGVSPNGGTIPPQGFKIHVSTVAPEALELLTIVAGCCIQRGITFKCAADPMMWRMLSSKNFTRTGGGKFITIYPPSTAVFQQLMEQLYERLNARPFHGPFILSDRRYKDSPVLYYRYGGFSKTTQLRADGGRDASILQPGGERFADTRAVNAAVPTWVDDPFGATGIVPPDGAPLIGGRFAVKRSLRFSNRGGVYLAVDQTDDKDVIIKEARPWIDVHSFADKVTDGRGFIRREYAVLQRLKDTGYAPQPVALFQDWEHLFIAIERVPGPTLENLWASERGLLFPFIHLPGVVEAFMPVFCTVARNIIAAIEAIHACGVIISDLSLRNVIVNPDTYAIRLIDFEAALLPDDPEDFRRTSARMYTASFGSPRRVASWTLEYADDWYGAGMLLFASMVSLQSFAVLNPDAVALWLVEVVVLGVPQAAVDVIQALLRGEPQVARQLLDVLEPQWTTP
ncbi:MAG: hypothetical protein JWM95_1201 [Gemmatimonadetes bacterium]|nr:hypothetical protein [Gemmatimonadota bacterium]